MRGFHEAQTIPESQVHDTNREATVSQNGISSQCMCESFSSNFFMKLNGFQTISCANLSAVNFRFFDICLRELVNLSGSS